MSAESWLPLRYRDFYDVPRLVVVEFGGRIFLFDSPFDDNIDGYPDHYTIYLLSESGAARLDDASWEGLSSIGKEIGRVPVAEVEFDETKRQRLNDSVFRRLGIE